MSKYKLTNKAVEDLTQIWNYTAVKWSLNQASLYYEMLINHFCLIADKPESGKSYSKILENLMGLKAGRHIIFYKINENMQIIILRILHEKMDVINRLNEK